MTLTNAEAIKINEPFVKGYQSSPTHYLPLFHFRLLWRHWYNLYLIVIPAAIFVDLGERDYEIRSRSRVKDMSRMNLLPGKGSQELSIGVRTSTDS